jgi:hypothetical protein
LIKSQPFYPDRPFQNVQTPGSGVSPLNYFDSEAPIAFLSGDLPH